LSTQGRPSRASAGLALAALDDLGARDRDLRALQHLGEVDLVGAAQDRVRVVDDREPLGLGAAREAIGVVVDRGRLADEQRVELGEARVVVAADELHAEALPPRRLHEAIQGLLVGRRLALLRIDQDREVVARAIAALRLVALAAEVAPRGVVHEIEVLLGDLVHRQRAHAAQAPLLAAAELGAQERHREHAEQRARERLVLGRHVLAEIDGQHEIVRLQPAEALLDQFLDVRRDEAHEARRIQVLDGAHVRHDAMAARLGQQRDVVAARLVAIGARQVEHPHAARRPGLAGLRYSLTETTSPSCPSRVQASGSSTTIRRLMASLRPRSRAGWRRRS
jgi:hypothetical protein